MARMLIGSAFSSETPPLNLGGKQVVSADGMSLTAQIKLAKDVQAGSSMTIMSAMIRFTREVVNILHSRNKEDLKEEL